MMLALIMAAVVHHAAPPPPKPNPNPNPNQFDLICVGKETAVLSNKVTGIEDATIRLRIDLDAKVWCGGECKRTYPIEGVISPSEIVLNDSDHDQFASQNHGDMTFESHFHIDRASGAMRSSDYAISYGRLRSGRSTEAMCEAAPFSGMPKAKF